MGCAETKLVRKINVTGAKVLEDDSERTQSAETRETRLSSGKSDISDHLPNQVLTEDEQLARIGATIPTCDLGESLDCRRFNQPHVSKSGSAQSTDSADSGVYELDEEYGFVITEHSAPNLVRQVEEEFNPSREIDLTITGQACPRMLSGYQKSRLEEQEIIHRLQEEGLIATAKNKAAGGVSFEIVDADAARRDEMAARGEALPSARLPPMKLEKLERRRKQHKKEFTPEDISHKLQMAEERRKQAEQERLKKIAAASKVGAPKEQAVEDLKQKQMEKFESTIEKREQHLRQLRDKLKKQHQKGAMVRLKKTLSAAPKRSGIQKLADAESSD